MKKKTLKYVDASVKDVHSEKKNMAAIIFSL